MASLDHTRALMAELAAVIGTAELPQDPSGGYSISVGTQTTVLIYGGDDEFILVVVPLGKLPLDPSYAVVTYLLGFNMFNSDTAPFVTATDEGGTLILWGKLRIDALDGKALGQVLDNLDGVATKIRDQAGIE